MLWMILIAATALSKGMVLVTHNTSDFEHFKAKSFLRLEDCVKNALYQDGLNIKKNRYKKPACTFTETEKNAEKPKNLQKKCKKTKKIDK